MKRVSVFIDGFNLYHAIRTLKKPHLKWVNVKQLAECFIDRQNEQILRVLFFTAPPKHTPEEVQARYHCYTQALTECGVHITEGKFKQKFVTLQHQGELHHKKTHEEKETDVNLALAILEDAYELISDKLIVITNDSDISPAIRMARKKNPNLKINVITPPFDVKRANYDLMEACGSVSKNKKGQVFFQTRFIKEIHLERSLLPEIIVRRDGTTLLMPKAYSLKL